MGKIKELIKKETVLTIATGLALVSCFFVAPDKAYFGYIDWRTLALLFCLMAVMAGFQEMGLFRLVGANLLKRVKGQKSLAFILVSLCFFSSMVVTNDVALITFVPFGLLVLVMARAEKVLCLTVTLMTIAANLGSMLTPIGNPQNLYLYNASGLSLGEFLTITLPYTIASGVLLAGAVWLAYRPVAIAHNMDMEQGAICKKQLLLYCLLFVLCLFTVAEVLPVPVLFLLIIAALLWKDKEILKKVDYCLLFTFIAFFIFIGNLERLPAFYQFISGMIQGNERMTAIGASQVISNVPAALLLSGFTQQWSELIIGTNLGGLGTLIASMASLISYKQIAGQYPHKKGRYLLVFTGWNVLFLGLFLLQWVIV